MNFDFSLILVVLTAATGAIWLIDHLVFSKPRRNKLSQFLAGGRISEEDFQQYVNSVDTSSKPAKIAAEGAQAGKDASKGVDPVRKSILEQALMISRDPVPVEYAKSFFPILFAVLVLRSFLLEPFQIPSASMVPTLNVGDFIVVNKSAYGVRLPVIGSKILDVGDPQRGDVMVFIPPHDPRYFIKRVIGLPGDHVRYADNIVYVNNEPLLQGEVEVLRGAGITLSHETIDGLTHSIHTNTPRRPAHDYEWLDAAGTLHKGWLGVRHKNRG